MNWTCVVSEHIRGEETAGADNEWEEPVAHGRCKCCFGSLYLILFDFSFSVRGRLRHFSCFVPDSFLLFQWTDVMKWCSYWQGLIIWKLDDITAELWECQNTSAAIFRHIALPPLPLYQLPSPSQKGMISWHKTENNTSVKRKQN